MAERKEKAHVLDRLRHVLAILLGAAVVVAVESILFTRTTPLIAGLAQADRTDLYNQVVVVSASLLGFLVAAVAILVSLDRTRAIVKRIQRAESFHLLVANMLGAIVMLFVLTLLGIVGAVAENDASASHWFERAYEWIALGSLFELTLAGFYFSEVMYLVAEHKDRDA